MEAELFTIDEYELWLLLAGAIALLAAIVPIVIVKRHITPPIIYIITGICMYLLNVNYQFISLKHSTEIEKITEFVVIVSLTNAGLKIKKPFEWRTWKYAVRLLVITMPVTIVAAAFAGWWIAGLAPAAALLFGAVMSPTDPVLASEFQTTAPGEEDKYKTKLTLTAEAGANDGLAFPFTYLAITAATLGTNYEEWAGTWFINHFLIKTAIGLAGGLLCGWALYKLVFSVSSADTISKISRGILSLALTLVPYGATELVGGYGFIAVFVAACVFSNYEDKEEHMESLHDFNEELENIFVAFIFIVSGMYMASNYEILLNPKIMLLALVMIFIIRPVAGWVSLAGTKLSAFQKFVVSFYGIRGIGSIYYLAYAFNNADFQNKQTLLNHVVALIFFSVLIHGFSARYIQKKIQKLDTDT
ncbi:hypothetical protein CHU92_09210 [Flavobacterium cyanobacteriorum]|uniref:Cation/H+ exchanger transmembrane domain-containing protein n=1 Tax=Flavobacterium cyanobacteriorum TaxID=2022802 RepID=A0A255Z776_9FLAO|nr:cation:proton antiporter [Flavobacterium cyanobacteriorum]OYQ36764.1 hypothetical protein CHU92_09210 [Flavobacterium cyanobacteriorum]